MSGWSNRLARDERGIAAVEFAFLLPTLLLVLVGMLELGRGFYHAHVVERGIRAAALYASRAEAPLSASDEDAAANIARTGQTAPGGDYTVPGWSHDDATITFTTRSYTVGDDSIQVLQVTADVPYVPMFPGLTDFFGLTDYTLTLQHEQAYVGL